MDELKEEKDAEAGRGSSSLPSLPMTVMPPERRRPENAPIRHWMNLGTRALDTSFDMKDEQEEQASENSEEDDVTPAA